MKKLLISLFLGLMASSSSYADDEFDNGGELNPDEMSIQQSIAKASRGKVDMMTCAVGYALTKKGDHEDARILFEECARQGWTGTMTWMSYMEQNGLGADENPEASAEWDKKAADLGDPIGMFNHGLDLLRGYGVAQNEKLGRSYIDKAAKYGLKAAKQLQAGDYDPEVVTPDADSWKFEKRLY